MELEMEMEQKISDDMPTMTDKQICKIHNKTSWRSDLWNQAVGEMRKRGIRPGDVQGILEA